MSIAHSDRPLMASSLRNSIAAGPLAPLATILGLEIFATVGLPVPTPGAILIAAVVVASFVGGLGGGMAAAAVTIGYTAWHYTVIADRDFLNCITRVAVIAITAPSVVLIIDILKQQADSRGRAVAMTNGALRDEIAQRQKIETALRDSEARFRLALQHVPITMFNQDADLRYTWIHNPPPGITPDDIIGRTDTDLTTPDEAATLTLIKRRVMRTGTGERQAITFKIGGTLRHYDLTVEPMRDSDGRISGITGAAIDNTGEAGRRTALEQARAEAERANQMKSRFFAAASHDLRQPFQAMRLFLHLLETRLTRPDQHELATRLGESLQAGESLLSALLDISKLEAATVKPDVVVFPVQDLLRRVEDEFRPLAEANGLEFTVMPCAAHIASDPILLGRMLTNLIANAVRYTPHGRVLIGCRPVHHGLRLEVWDTGPGIPEDQINLIFEAFHQLNNAARDRKHGLGLGLAIVRRTARLLDHTVNVRSTVGKGSVFSIEVMLAADNTRRVTRHTVTAAPRRNLNGAMIAIIEDDPLQLLALRTMLEDWGCQAVSASSCENAITALRQVGRAPDLVLSDFRLPGAVSGAQAISAIRAEFGAAIPGLLVTGDTGTDIDHAARNAGLGILHKPLHPNRLRAGIEKALITPSNK